MKNGEIFRVGASDTGQRPQLVYAVGGAECSEASNSRVAVCCIGFIELVAAPEPAILRVLANRLVHGKGKITGDTKTSAKPTAHSCESTYSITAVVYPQMR